MIPPNPPTDPIVLDHIRGITLDPLNPPLKNYQVFQHNYSGLKILADSVREQELHIIRNDPYASGTFFISGSIPPIIPCAFNWFSVTLVNYLRLVGLVDLMNQRSWQSTDLANPENRNTIREHCGAYVKDAIPEIHLWRNKVAAHFAATDPFKDDSLGTLEQSIMNPVTYMYPHYYVGLGTWITGGTESKLPTWALTKIYEELSPRFWPEMQLEQFPS